MGPSAPDSVKRLVDLFDRDRKAFLSADYKEEQIRPEFVVWRFEFGVRTFLGMPVIHEESIKVAGATKAPDYTFRTRSPNARSIQALVTHHR